MTETKKEIQGIIGTVQKAWNLPYTWLTRFYPNAIYVLLSLIGFIPEHSNRVSPE